jgi:hypothetical protein
MQHNEEIEMLLWDFIDGNCNEAESMRIKSLIADNREWKQKFEELISLHQSISPDLEQPSLRFTKNVMDAVAQTHIAPSAKKYINIYIIRSIAAFFIITIVCFLVYTLSISNWNSNSSDSVSQLNTAQLHMGRIFSSNIMYAFILINIVLGLLLADTFLRKRKLGGY